MPENEPIVTKLAFTFGKHGLSGFYSHHDLMRVFERGLRRAGLPVRLTAGFNPRPRIVFPHALSLGVDSECEQVEVEFRRKVDAKTACEALHSALMPVVMVTNVQVLPPVKKGRRVKSCVYEIRGWPDTNMLDNIKEKIVSAQSLPVSRFRQGRSRELDLRPWISNVEISGNKLAVTLLHTDKGAGNICDLLDWFDIADLRATKVRMELQ